jgi:predicted GH43/DUF377 family glycosyl hydrolase
MSITQLKEFQVENVKICSSNITNELQWERMQERMLQELGKDDAAMRSEKKSARWKVWIANVLKSHSSATNVWIATKLNMGAAQSVSVGWRN